MSWISHPACIYALLAAGLAACLYLFCSTKQEIGRTRNEHRALQAALGRAQAELAELSMRLLDAEQIAGAMVTPPPARSGLNLTRRAQVLRLARRGQNPSQIAAAVGIPEGEVELILKVHNLVAPPAELPAAAPEPHLTIGQAAAPKEAAVATEVAASPGTPIEK